MVHAKLTQNSIFLALYSTGRKWVAKNALINTRMTYLSLIITVSPAPTF
ncbi:MAG: hypothetical protein PHV80_08695 [Rugosibacter sp.]|nr:hypothetical protein [Rugosibacter sp.]